VPRRRIAYLALVAASLLYGATFVVVKDAIVTLPPLGFVGWRFLLGAAALVAFVRPRGARLWRDGTVAGILLFAGYAFQTQGLSLTTASNSGLITGLYVVFTPLLSAAVRRSAPRPVVVGGALVAFAGLAALTIEDGLRLQGGDLLTIACAAAFAGHIVWLARTARHHPVVPFTAVQLAITAAGGLVLGAVLESPGFPPASIWPALLLTGLGVSAGAFLMQIWAQTVIGPNRTAIVLALEPAFAALTAMAVLGERLTARGWLGAVLILAGIYAVLAVTGDEDELPAAEAITPAH
jgi:drug/metabolite transporter (DMT)-like permease